MSRKLEAALIFGLLMAMMLSPAASFGKRCEQVRSGVLRLHILANSDSEEDQALKLRVRDELLRCYGAELAKEQTLQDAEEWVGSHIDEITRTANCVLAQSGSSQTARAEIARSFFRTRTYDDGLILPAGYYDALKIRIGKAEGHNWWCVMYPPVCIPAAAEPEQTQEIAELSENASYRLSFWVVEATEELVQKLGELFE